MQWQNLTIAFSLKGQSTRPAFALRANAIYRIRMKADRVEVTWDEQKKKWLARIVIGEEVIRRYFDQAKNANQDQLKSTAAKTAIDEGYEVDPASIAVK